MSGSKTNKWIGNLKAVLIGATIVANYYVWNAIYIEVSNTVPLPYSKDVAFASPLSYRNPKKVVAKSEVINKVTGEKQFALIAEDKNVICIVDKEKFDAFKIGDMTDCNFIREEKKAE